MFTLLLAGALGGLIRGIVGFIKHQFAYKNVEFKPAYVATIMILSALVGVTITWAIADSGLHFEYFDQLNPALAVIIGYAGGDIVENIYKIIIGKASIFPLPKK